MKFSSVGVFIIYRRCDISIAYAMHYLDNFLLFYLSIYSLVDLKVCTS